MTAKEWLETGEHIAARWPQSPPSLETMHAWYEDVADLAPEQVRAAIASFSRDGREWPPTGGMLRKRVFELAIDAPAFGDAWEALLRAVRKFGHGRRSEATEWLSDRHALYAELARKLGWRDLCLSEEIDVVRGQARRIYTALVEQTTRDHALRGLPDSGLAALERVNSPEYRELVQQTLRQMPQLRSAE